MPNYQKLYHKLFNDITDIIEDLKKSQQEAEEMYSNSAKRRTKSKTKKGTLRPEDRKYCNKKTPARVFFLIQIQGTWLQSLPPARTTLRRVFFCNRLRCALAPVLWRLPPAPKGSDK